MGFACCGDYHHEARYGETVPKLEIGTRSKRRFVTHLRLAVQEKKKHLLVKLFSYFVYFRCFFLYYTCSKWVYLL